MSDIAIDRPLTQWEIGMRRTIASALLAKRGNMTHASQFLEISHATLRTYMKKFRIYPYDEQKIRAVLQ